jgi:hypothetical protein
MKPAHAGFVFQGIAGKDALINNELPQRREGRQVKTLFYP